jgi:hypothetical protein
MSYKLYTDKPEIFAADIQIKNASLKNAFARIIVESNELSLVFNGKIENDKCTIPIKRLSGFLNENDRGKIKLEIVAESTYFVPWSDDFIVEEHTSVKVQVKEQKEAINKPIVEVKIKKPTEAKLSLPSKELISLCKKFNITSKNIKSPDFKQLLKEYFTYNKEFIPKIKSILNEVVSNLK